LTTFIEKETRKFFPQPTVNTGFHNAIFAITLLVLLVLYWPIVIKIMFTSILQAMK